MLITPVSDRGFYVRGEEEEIIISARGVLLVARVVKLAFLVLHMSYRCLSFDEFYMFTFKKE